MPAPAIRINARLTGEHARRFKELQASYKASASEVLRKAIDGEHARAVKPRKSVYQAMLDSGLIGCIKNAPPDSSSKEGIRRAMDDVLRAKYPHQFQTRK